MPSISPSPPCLLLGGTQDNANTRPRCYWIVPRFRKQPRNDGTGASGTGDHELLDVAGAGAAGKGAGADAGAGAGGALCGTVAGSLT